MVDPPALLGPSAALAAVRATISRFAQSDQAVLILGETGTGKELAAHLVHTKSRRADKAFVPVCAGTMPEQLFESLMFGHRRGAFTGASQNQTGLFAAADQGTLFLDEIGELAPSLQVKLLRALEDGSFLPLGASLPSRSDVRVIAATNLDVDLGLSTGQLRADFLFRIDVLRLTLPPLRVRPDDLRFLLVHFLETQSGRTWEVSDEVWAHLERWSWPGNVRELRHLAERIAVLGHVPGKLTLQDLPPNMTPGGANDPPRPLQRLQLPLTGLLARYEQQLIEDALAVTAGNLTAAASLLGVSRQMLSRKLRRKSSRP